MSSLNIETCESLAKSLTEEKVSLPWFCEDLFKVTNDIINALNPTAPEHAEAFLSLKRHVLETDQLALAIKILDICFRGTLPPSMTTSSLEHVCPDARLENTDAEYLLNFRDEIATKLITSTGEILTPILNKLAGHPFNRSLRRHMLVQAIKSSEKEKVLLLIDKAQHPRKMGLVAFFHAASLGNLELVQTLLVKTQPSDNHKIKALIQAVRAKQEETGLFLLGQIQGPISEESQTEILKQSIPQSLTRFTIAFSEQYPLSPGMYLHAENSWWESQETNLLLSHIKRSPQGPGSAQRLNSKHPLSLMLQEALATKDPEKLNRAFDELKKENRIPSCIVQNKIQEKQNIRFTLQNIFNRPDFQEILPLVFSDRTLWMDATYTGLWPEFYQIFSQTHLLTTQDPHMLNILRWVLTKPAQLSNLMRIVFSLNQHTAMSQIIPEYPRLQELIDNLNHLDPLDFIKTTNYSPMHLGIALIIAAQTNNPEAVQTLLLPATNIEQIYLDAALRATRSIEMVQVLLPNHSFSPSVLHSTIGWIVENEPDQRNASLLSLFLDAGLDDEGLNIFFESLTSPESQQLNFSLFYNFIKQKDTDSWMGNLQKYKEEISNCLWNNSLDLIWRRWLGVQGSKLVCSQDQGNRKCCRGVLEEETGE